MQRTHEKLVIAKTNLRRPTVIWSNIPGHVVNNETVRYAVALGLLRLLHQHLTTPVITILITHKKFDDKESFSIPSP